MQIDIKDGLQGKKIITIKVDTQQQQPFLDKAAAKLSLQKPVAGFRPGKAPREVVEKKYGAMAVLEKAVDDIITQTYYQTIKEQGLTVVGRPEIEIKKLAPGEDFEYTATVVLLPQVKLGDLNKVSKIVPPAIEVNEQEIEEVLKDLQKMRATEKPVEREVKQGDKVEIDFTIKDNDVEVEGGSGKKYPLILGEKMFIPGFEENILGMKKGEEKTFSLSMPKGMPHGLGGKRVEVDLKVVGVYERVFPPLDDNLAKQAGNYKNLAELKEQIKKNLLLDKQSQAEKKLEMEMLEKVVEVSEFGEIPEALIEQELHKMMHELEDDLRQQNITLDDYLARVGKKKEDLHKDWRDLAIKRIKTALVARQIAVENNIQASQEEVEQELETLQAVYQNNQPLLDQLKSAEFKDYLAHTIANRKVITYLKKTLVDDKKKEDK